MNIFSRNRTAAKEQVRNLLEDQTHDDFVLQSAEIESYRELHYIDGLQRFLLQANLNIPPALLLSISFLSGAAAAFAFSKLLSIYFIPVFGLFGALLPFLWVESRVRARAIEFAADYPSMLLAASSSVRAGLTPYQALERSTRLLQKQSLVRKEVDELLRKLRQGNPRAQAIEEFGISIRQPDLALFRSAFALILENGGRFAPTLMRLAKVSNNRATLIRGADVSTAGMRMTANILLVIAPMLVLLIAVRTENFWDIFFNNSVANFLASAGIVTITICYLVLRRMSNFKP